MSTVTKAKLVEQALHVLRARGPEHFSARAVARDAGVSVSLISHHFGGREELLDELSLIHI